MMKKLILYVFFLSSVVLFANTPHVITITTNDQTFVSGDKLLYSVYCVNSSTRNLDKNVLASYVELISSDYEKLFHHKVEMNGGIGQGDFLIPVGIPTGSYKLLGYTNAIKQKGLTFFFQLDIQIVNPYENQSNIFESDVNDVENFNTITNSISEGPFEVKLSKAKASTREKLQLVLQTQNRNRLKGNFSVSIRKKLNNSYQPRLPDINKSNFNEKVTYENLNQIVSGKVINKITNDPLVNGEVILSIGGDNFVFDIETTNSEGEFSFSGSQITARKTAMIELISNQQDIYEIILDIPEDIDYSALQFSSLDIQHLKTNSIESQAVYNQIESAYSNVKVNETLPIIEAPSFIKYENKESYVLDDYTAFPTMGDIILEYVDYVWSKRDKVTKLPILKAAPKDLTVPAKSKMLLFIDGVYQNDVQAFLAMDSNLFKKVEVIRNKYQFALTEYEGVLLAYTKSNDYRIEAETNTRKFLQLDTIEPKKKYYNPNYTEPTKTILETIPDYRTQLLWIPSASLDSNAWVTSFSTSDISGIYEVLIAGYTSNGKPFHNILFLEVE